MINALLAIPEDYVKLVIFIIAENKEAIVSQQNLNANLVKRMLILNK